MHGDSNRIWLYLKEWLRQVIAIGFYLVVMTMAVGDENIILPMFKICSVIDDLGDPDICYRPPTLALYAGGIDVETLTIDVAHEFSPYPLRGPYVTSIETCNSECSRE